METKYDIIIWGSSPRGIARAISLKNSGKNVLLASRFGFPGGKHTESLSAFFGTTAALEDSLEQKLVSRAAALPFGILHQSSSGILLHPEAIKRICWEWINKSGITALFHVVPAGVENLNNELEVKFFGREGFFNIRAGAVENHADNIPFSGIQHGRDYNVLIHALFTDPLPLNIPGFNLVHNIDTAIGRFISISLRRVKGSEIDNSFNRELNRLSTEGWSKYHSRIMMIPVYPEIKPSEI